MFERDAARNVLLAVVVIGAVSAAVTPVSGDVASGDRRVPGSVTAGETVTVTVTATMDGDGGPFSLSEEFSGPVASVNVQRVTVDGESVSVRSVSNANGTVVTLANTSENAQVEVTYQLTAAQSDGRISITGQIAGGTTINLGLDTITVEAAQSSETTTTTESTTTTTESTTTTTESSETTTTTESTTESTTTTTTIADTTTTSTTETTTTETRRRTPTRPQRRPQRRLRRLRRPRRRPRGRPRPPATAPASRSCWRCWRWSPRRCWQCIASSKRRGDSLPSAERHHHCNETP